MGRRARVSTPDHVADDDGFALPLALAIVLIIAILATAVLSQAAFDLSQGGRVERRVKAVNAAEAGLSWYFRHLASKATKFQLTSSPWKAQSGVGHYSRPASAALGLQGATFSIDVQYLENDPCPTTASPTTLLCNWQSDADKFDIKSASSNLPDEFFAIVTSTGIAGTGRSEVVRALQSAVRLHPVPGTGLPYAVSSSAMCIEGSVSISGDVALAGDAAFPSGYPCAGSKDLVIDANQFTLTSGDLYLKSGNLQATGSSTSLNVHGDVWTGASATLVGGPGAPSTTKCKPSNKICIWGDFLYGSTPSISGDVAVLGAKTQSPDSPPVDDFQPFNWVSADWEAKNWTVDTSGWPATTWAANTVYYISSGCPPSGWPGKVTLNGDVAVVSQSCGFTFDTNSQFSGTGKISFIVVDAGGACSSTSASNIRVENGPTFLISGVYFFTPCVLDVQNNSGGIKGQMFGRFLYFKQSQKITFLKSVPTPLPGATASFRVDVRYITEVPV